MELYPPFSTDRALETDKGNRLADAMEHSSSAGYMELTETLLTAEGGEL